MSIIPLRQTVSVTRLLDYDPDYNEPKYSEPSAYKCRFQEQVQLTRSQHGQEVVSVGSFLFPKLADISVNDKLTFRNENGVETTYTPISISVKRGLSGEPLLTKIHV